MSDLSKVSVSAPLVIVRSQRHSSNSHAGILAEGLFCTLELIL